MNVFAAVMTDKGTGAISTIQVFGDRAQTVVNEIFKPTGTKPAKFKAGKILLGTITDGAETIDQVTIGCEGPHSFAINCHGNPLIVEMIMQLLGRRGAELLTAEQLLYKILSAQKNINTITLEAKLTQPKAKTIEGTKIIANQIEAGLTKKAKEWLDNINAISLKEISTDAEQILENSRIAKLIITGCKVAIAGPPNTGKSTLLNYLAGRQKAIVTNIKGTTRDWVTARCRIGPLSVELIDTAGLDEKLAATKNTIEKKSQQKSAQILDKANLVLLVLDNSKTSNQLDDWFLENITDKLVLTVLNKSDLPAKFDTGKLPQILSNTIQISAKAGTGIENLTEKIQQLCGVADFDLHAEVCITGRQEKLLHQLKKTKSRQQATSIITELLNGDFTLR
jgi:tRNA modification GTPase